MSQQWNDNQPIYRQIRDRIVGLILEGAFQEGDPIPSVRQLASDYQINHLTVSKAYQELVSEEWVEKKRGLGMFVMAGARDKIMDKERQKFMDSELPEFLSRISQLDVNIDDVIERIKQQAGEK